MNPAPGWPRASGRERVPSDDDAARRDDDDTHHDLADATLDETDDAGFACHACVDDDAVLTGREAADDSDDSVDPVRRPPPLRTADDGQLATLIESIVDQDERALAALYDATFTRVYGIVHRIVRRAALAEEVVEDTYFQVWRQAVRFDASRGQALTWLLSMARSRAIDALRREARFQYDTLDDEQAEAAIHQHHDAQGSDELLAAARHHADLHRALMLLGAQPRQLVSLAFFRGLSHEEIASQTALPLGTVKSQIRRALLSLRQILGDAGIAGLAT